MAKLSRGAELCIRKRNLFQEAEPPLCSQDAVSCLVPGNNTFVNPFSAVQPYYAASCCVTGEKFKNG
jgi:hypothetical protein